MFYEHCTILSSHDDNDDDVSEQRLKNSQVVPDAMIRLETKS